MPKEIYLVIISAFLSEDKGAVAVFSASGWDHRNS